MQKIEKLTPEQEIELVKFRQEWFKWCVSTEPANRELAEQAILKMYNAIGQEKKPTFVWCDSPTTCLLAIEFISKLPEIAAEGGKLESSLESSLGSSLESSLGSSLESSLRSSLESSLRSSLWSSLESSLGSSLGSSLRSSLESSLRSSLWSSLRSSLRSSARERLWRAWWGQQETYWIAFYLFGRDQLKVEYDQGRSEQLDMWRDLAQSCCWWWSYENFVFISERPEICEMEPFQNAERLHSLNGPALKFRDGYALYQVHGVTVPAFVVENPEQITIETIQGEENQEVKRIMIDQFGRERFIRESGAQAIHEDSWGILYVKDQDGNDPLTFVEVINSTAEPDGTFRHFFLDVHPELCPISKGEIVGDAQEMTALNAVASTFGKTGREYVLGLTGDINGTPEMAIALGRMS